MAKLATFDQEEPWDPVALQLAFGDATWRFLQSQVQARPTLLGRPSVGDERLLDALGLLIGRRRDAGELTSCIDLLAAGADAADPAGPLALARGLAQGLSESGESLRRLRGDAAQPEALATALTKTDKLLTRAQAVALAETASRRRRLAALSLLSQAGTAGDPADLLPLLGVDQLPDISAAAADCLARLAEAKLAEQLFAGWTSYSAATRRALAAAALRSPPATEALLAAIEAGTIVPLELEAAVRDVLVQLPDAALKERAGKALAAAIPADRQKVLADYAAALTLSADRRRGGALVAQHCLACHQILGRGKRIGPDLSGIGSHPKEQQLVSLLDPSRQVSPDFLAYTLITHDGEVLSGLLAGETADSVTLRRAEGNDEIVPRSNIESLKAAGKSLMPDGFEQKLSVPDVADVIDFLIHPDAALLVAPDGASGTAP